MSRVKFTQEEGKLLWALLVAAVLLFLLFIWVEGCTVEREPSAESDATEAVREAARAWVQLLSGTALPDLKALQEPDQRPSCLLFATAEAFYTLLSATTGLGFLWFLYQVLVERRRRPMELAELLSYQEDSLRVQVESLALEDVPEEKFPERLQKVDELFERANDSFREKLEIVLGRDKAREVLEAMKKIEL